MRRLGFNQRAAVEDNPSTALRTEPNAPAWLTKLQRIESESLVTFLHYFGAELAREAPKVFLHNERALHELMRKLSEDVKAPSFLKELFWDADGPYLKSQDLRDAWEGAAWYLFDCYGLNSPNQINRRIDKKLEELAKRPKEYRDFVAKAVAEAKLTFKSAS